MFTELPWTAFEASDAAAFLAAPGNAALLAEELRVSNFLLGLRFSQAPQLQRAGPLVWPCTGCNTAVQAGHAEGGHHGAAPAARAPTVWGPVHQALHWAVLVAGFVRSLLIWRDPVLAPHQEALYDMLATPTPQRADLYIREMVEQALAEGKIFYGLMFINLVGVVDNCSGAAPKAAHFAVQLMSLLVSRRPATVLGMVDPDPLAAALIKYLGAVFSLVSNPCCAVENYFGVADVINALPLLYHAGDWPEAARHLVKHRVPTDLGSLSVNLVHTATRPGEGPLDGEIDLDAWPECCHVIVTISELFEAAPGAVGAGGGGEGAEELQEHRGQGLRGEQQQVAAAPGQQRQPPAPRFQYRGDRPQWREDEEQQQRRRRRQQQQQEGESWE